MEAKNSDLYKVPENTKKVQKRSLINEYFSKELMLEITKITLISDADNNAKGVMIRDLLTKNGIPQQPLGSGTNRIGVLIDGYAVKIALDNEGKIDNRKEFLYTKELYPYVVKVYECVPSGLIAVTEYVEIFKLEDFHVYREEMEEILETISKMFLIGDVGITARNYVNWGKRNDDTICILDFAYVYSVKYSVFTCSCNDTALLKYDKNYDNLICPYCGRKYTFGEIRRRITRKQHEDEIGDIRRLGYNLTESIEEVPMIPKFEPKDLFKKDKKKDSVKQTLKEIRKNKHSEEVSEQDWDNHE